MTLSRSGLTASIVASLVAGSAIAEVPSAKILDFSYRKSRPIVRYADAVRGVVHTMRMRVGGALLSFQSRKKARSIGRAVRFPSLSPRWVKPLVQDMDQHWQELGMKGLNTYTFGAKKSALHRYSERTNPDSPLYQAWVGAYIVNEGGEKMMTKEGTLDPKKLTKLAEYDQRAWLAYAGDTNPNAKTINIVRHPRDASVWLIEATSRSDLTTKPALLSKFLGAPDHRAWKNKLDSYHPVTIRSYYTGYFDPTIGKKGGLVVKYAAGLSSFTTKDGQTHDHFTKIDKELKSLFDRIEVARP